MTSKVKDQGRKATWSAWAVLAQCCTCVIRGRRGDIVSAKPGGHTSCLFRLFTPSRHNELTWQVEDEVVVMELLKTVRYERIVVTEQLFQLGYLQSVHH